MVTIRDSLTHPTLERIDLRISADFNEPNDVEPLLLSFLRLEDIKQFKGNAWKNLPNLTDAKFTFSMPVFHYPHPADLTEASFSAREDHIIMRYRNGIRTTQRA